MTSPGPEHGVILEGQLAAQNRECARIPGEVVSADDVGETQPAVQSPRAVVLAADLWCRQQDICLAAARQQPPGKRLAQARYTDPSARSFTGAAMWMGLSALLVAALIGTLAWVSRDQSPRVGQPEDR